jgi:hypothetical protein
MTDPARVFRTKGGKAACGIRALQSGPLFTNDLARAMGVNPRRVMAYMLWAVNAGAVAIVARGSQRSQANPLGVQTLWGIGDVPTDFGRDHRPYRARKVPEDDDTRDPLPPRRIIGPASEAPRVEIRAAVSVFEWRP